MRNFAVGMGLLFSCGIASAGSVRWMTPDFYVERSEAALEGGASPASCRSHIREVMCPVEGTDWDNSQESGLAKCLPGGEAYAPQFEALYDQYPPALQKVFCGLRRIYLIQDFFGTAFSGLVQDAQGNPVGSRMGIRKSLLDRPLSLSQWASWKEQLSFGGPVADYETAPGLPMVSSAQPHAEVQDFLYFVIAHEFGHILDYANGINRYADPKCMNYDANLPEPECAVDPASWSGLSWVTNLKPRPEAALPGQDKLCFYACTGGGYLAGAATDALYEALYTRSNYPSAYGSGNIMDDFAETLAYYLVETQLGASYLVDTGRGRVYDAVAHQRSAAFASKRRMLEKILARDDLLYPMPRPSGAASGR